MIHPAKSSRLAPIALSALALVALAGADDPIRQLQNEYATRRSEKAKRAYHFGSQGAGDVFSNHTSHTNRLIPVYVFGKKADLGSVTGKNSRYRDPARIAPLYGGVVPPNTVNPAAEYADQSDLYRVQKEAVARGVKYLFIVWFDGMDWDTTRAAAIARTGKVYDEGKGSGLFFQDYDAGGSARFGYYVTSPTHDKNEVNLDAQTVAIPPTSLLGGYDAEVAGPNPWTPGRLKAPGYIKGQSANAADVAGLKAVGRVPHAYTDSSQSAGEIATGVKSYNNGVNVTDDNRFVPTLFNMLQASGWRVGTATSVPFDHVSPAAMYAHNVHRDDYQDLARDMLGLVSIAQEDGREPRHPGLDVVLGAGVGQPAPDSYLKHSQGKNANSAGSNTYIADADLRAIDVKSGGPYVVARRTPEVNGREGLLAAAESAAKGNHRLFGIYGTSGEVGTSHLPFRTADGDYKPAIGGRGTRETYSREALDENPTLADMTAAALTVLSAHPEGKPIPNFAFFVEAGDVDFALHDNNLDNAIGAVYSGEEAVKAIVAWVEKHSNWDDSALIVSADHGHYLVVDDPGAIAGKAGGK